MVDFHPEALEQRRIARARLVPVASAPAGDRNLEARLDQPDQAVERLVPGVGSPFLLVQLLSVMVETDAHHDLARPGLGDLAQGFLEPPHRPHRVGQHEQLEPALQG